MSIISASTLGGLLRQNVIVALLAAIFVALSVSSRTFLTFPNIANILSQQAPIMIMAVAAVFVLVAGGLDLSIGAIYGLAGVVTIIATNAAGPAAGVLAGLGAGLAIGAVNGVLVAYAKINSLIATVATSFVVVGLTNIASNSSVVSSTDRTLSGLAITRFLGLTLPTWIAFVIIIIGAVILARSPYGRRVYATGGNETAAWLSGVNTRLIRASTFALSGAAAGVAGLLSAALVSTAQVGTGSGLEFTVLTGVVVGGVSILGGAGVVWRGVTGVLLLALIGNGSDQLGLDPLYKSMLLGAILLAAVGTDAWARQRRG